MGMNDRLEDGRPAKRKRGSADNSGKLAGLRASQGKTTNAADWSKADPRWVLAVVVQVAGEGGAVRFGYSRDKGAYSLGIYLGGESETLWFNGDADLDIELEKVWVTMGGS